MNPLRLSHALALCVLVLASSSHAGQEPAKPAPGWQVTVSAKAKIVITSPQGNEMICRYIAPGEFTMGNKDGYLPEPDRNCHLQAMMMTAKHKKDEGPLRLTKITKGFYMLDTKVWTALYCQFLNDVERPERYYFVSAW